MVNRVMMILVTGILNKPLTFTFVLIFANLFSFSVYAEQPVDSLYLQGSKDSALILCHGRGKSPDWKVVGPLRKNVNEKMNWHTLSLQMPAEDKHWEEYADDFPLAYKTILEAVKFLQEDKKVKNIYLMGHSMGARMISTFIAENKNTSIAGLVVAGCRNNGGHPLSCSESLDKVKIPVLDIWGGNNRKDNNAADERESLINDKYQQVAIDGANHKFDGYDSEFTSAVTKWLATQ